MKGDGSKGKPRPNYASLAFHNPYNYALMGGVGAVGVMTGNWWMLIAGAGVEALWMLFAPDSTLLKKLVWDPKILEDQRDQVEDKFQQILDKLNQPLWNRFRWVVSSREGILRLSASNPSFTAELLRDELQKLDTLTLLYGDLACTLERYERYLNNVDLEAIEREARRLEGMVQGSTGEIARKNLAILDRRKEKLREIEEYMVQAQAQMGLIESTFQLLGDQVVTLQSPHELGGQLDELIDGVEAVRDVSRETERILQAEV